MGNLLSSVVSVVDQQLAGNTQEPRATLSAQRRRLFPERPNEQFAQELSRLCNKTEATVEHIARATLSAQRQTQKPTLSPEASGATVDVTGDYRAKASLCAQQRNEPIAESVVKDYREESALFSERPKEQFARNTQEPWRLCGKTEATVDYTERATPSARRRRRRRRTQKPALSQDAWRFGTTVDATDDYKAKAKASLCAQRRGELIARPRKAGTLGNKAEAKSQSNAVKKQAKLKAEPLFNKNNARKHVRRLDLHGFSVKEAIEKVEQRIALCKEMGQKNLVVIVGKGNHSKNGKAILKPMVQKFLQENGLSFFVGKPSDGCMLVDCKRRPKGKRKRPTKPIATGKCS